MKTSKEFVEGWDIVQVLGEGAYGEVVLILNQKTQEAVAAKVIDTSMSAEALEISRKEAVIHRNLSHKNILKFYGYRDEKNSSMKYLFLEYASGGELFDRIEPDLGMPTSQAQKYFSEIIDGVEYLHSIGIAHRDLKPENVLLDQHDTVKISDFGLATIFRHNGKERLLSKRCGTLPYVAPEVFNREYSACPADIWSCGIILVAMLAGELPWDKPIKQCKEYACWKDSKYTHSPWTKIDNLALSLLQKILNHFPKRRYSIGQIKKHLWLSKADHTKAVTQWMGVANYKRLCSDVDRAVPYLDKEELSKMSFSQPESMSRDHTYSEYSSNTEKNSLDVLKHGICFSQPAYPDDMILSSQIATSQEDSLTLLERLVVKRMTRFFIEADEKKATKELKSVLDKLGYKWKRIETGQVVVTTIDRRNMQLVFRATLVEMKHNILLDFRLSRGDGLEFKRHFLAIKRCMSNLVVKEPLLWPLVVSTVP